MTGSSLISSKPEIAMKGNNKVEEAVFLESIKVKGGNYFNLEGHSRRIERTCRNFFGSPPGFSLSLVLPPAPSEGLFKARVIYSKVLRSVELEPYFFPEIKKAILVRADGVSYPWKYLNRGVFTGLKANAEADEIIIVKNGLLSDSSRANLVFENSEGLFTPESPLLKGVKREELMGQGRLAARRIGPDQLGLYRKIYFVNAMIDLEDNVSIPLSSLLPHPGFGHDPSLG
jgi:4-amino-4-deoxychorismate lyase